MLLLLQVHIAEICNALHFASVKKSLRYFKDFHLKENEKFPAFNFPHIIPSFVLEMVCSLRVGNVEKTLKQ